MKQIPGELANARVCDMNGVEVRVGDLWRERPVVLVFVRHFGCIFCQAAVNQLKPHFSAIHDKGYDIVLIGTGGPSFAKGFAERMGLDVTILSDPERVTFRAAHLQRAWWRLVHPMAGVGFLKALARGNWQRCQQGDQTQQGGTLVVRTDGSIAFEHINEYSGDDAKPEQILAAL